MPDEFEHDANKERLELALEAAGLDLWENNLVTGEVARRATKTFAELGYSDDEANFLVDDMFTIVHPDDVCGLKRAVAEHMSGASAQYRCEFRLRSKQGTWVWYANYGKIMGHEKDGHRFIGVTFNIDDRKKREEESIVREQESRTLIENSPDIIVRYDKHCRCIYVNPAAAMIRGGVALLGKTPAEFPGGKHFDEYQQMIATALASGLDSQFELQWVSHDQHEICSHIRLTVERDLTGNIVSILAVGRDITELNDYRTNLRQANGMLENMNFLLQSLATSDPLTRLPNRRLLLDRLKQALASSSRSGLIGALLFIDLDNFKVINDTLGHDCGDLLLQQVAFRLEACVREGDTVARIGGDEFVVMLEDLSVDAMDAASQAELVGHKIISALNLPYHLASREHRSTPSIGITLFFNHEQSVDELLKQADIAMYESKKDGRNTLRFFDPHMQDTVNARAELEEELRYALEHDQFKLHYQIQVDSDHRSLGAEALIRWEHPERGQVLPMQFIPMAEESDLILLIGQWVIETACAQLKEWEQNKDTRDIVLSINVSAKQFLRHDFVSQLVSAVRGYGIRLGMLKLELTESLLLGNVEEIILNMNELREVGVRFSLDDFGTGYSSLQYLKRLPFDQIKIDRSFVRDIELDVNDKTIVRTIIAMAKSLKLDVIAEGVETAEQRELLMGKGCTHYQGYLFGRPVSAGEFNEALKKSV